MIKRTIMIEINIPEGKTCKGCHYSKVNDIGNTNFKCDMFNEDLSQFKNGDLEKCNECLALLRIKEII